MKYYILFNPLAGNGCAEAETHRLDTLLAGDELIYISMKELSDYGAFFASTASELQTDVRVIISGGDGTLNRFVNATDGIPGGIGDRDKLWYYATGSGNDFLHDLGMEKGAPPFPIGEYLRGLPRVTINGRSYRFLNDVGFGIDGYCCEVGDRKRAVSGRPVNYTPIALGGLMGGYHFASASVTVDGVTRQFGRVLMAPTMKGRFFGGGMMVAPGQDRRREDGRISVIVVHDVGRLRALMLFPSIFKGEHVKNTDIVEVIEGYESHVVFDRPTALQIDGETFTGITEYTVTAGKTAEV